MTKHRYFGNQSIFTGALDEICNNNKKKKKKKKKKRALNSVFRLLDVPLLNDG